MERLVPAVGEPREPRATSGAGGAKHLRAVARLSPEATFHHLSGQGADPSGRWLMMWARVKEAENALEGLGLRLFIYRPGYIHPTTAMPGLGAAVSRAAFPLLRAVNAAVSDADLARAMLTAAEGSASAGLNDNAAIRALAATRAARGSRSVPGAR